MIQRRIKIVAISTLALTGAGLVWSQTARPQINAAPSWVPLGVSSSGINSTAWFHEPSSRQLLACQTVPAQGSGVASIQCLTVKLP